MWKAPHVSLPGSKKLAEKKAKKQVSKRPKAKALKPWDDSVNDLGTYKLSAEELEQRLAKRVSKNRVVVPQCEVQKIKKEISAKKVGPDAAEDRSDQAKDAPSGWCLDFAAIAEGLKQPPSEDQSSDTPRSHQIENRDPDDSSQYAKSSRSGGVSTSAERTPSRQEPFGTESSSNQSEVAETGKHPGKGTESRDNTLAEVGNMMPKAPSLEVRKVHVARSPGSINVTPVATTRKIAPIEKPYGRSDGQGEMSSIHLLQNSSRLEMDSLRGEVQELRRDMHDLKSELQDFVSHYSSMMTTVQSQIQQLLGFRERQPLSASTRPGPRVMAQSECPQESITRQSNTPIPTESSGRPEQSHLLVRPPTASIPGYEACQNRTPAQSDFQPTRGMMHPVPSFSSGPCSGAGDNLPSYAQMRRSEIECTTNKSLREILQPPSDTPKTHSFPGSVVIPTTLDVGVDQAPRGHVGQVDFGGDIPSQSSVPAKLRQNVPGTWVRPNTILPQHPAYPTGPRAFALDLNSTVSLSAYAPAGRPPIGAKPKEKGGRFALA